MFSKLQENPSYVSGPRDQPLWSKTLGSVIAEQSQKYSDRIAVSFPQQRVRMTYQQLASSSGIVANALIESGLQPGDCVGILSGNCYQYIEVFLGGGRIGCPVVVLNNTYSPQELIRAVTLARCKALFISASIGRKSLAKHITLVRDGDTPVRQIVTISGSFESSEKVNVIPYVSFKSLPMAGFAAIQQRESIVQPNDVLNLQFTSGTTGSPKAAMLTHINLINNGRFVGNKMRLTPQDIVCCPPPLFHCFGLVLGFLAAFTHGSSIVFPSDQFDADCVLDAIVTEKCTALLGVPTMFLAEMEANKKRKLKITTVRTGLASGSQVPLAVMQKLQDEMNIHNMLIAYGMTETSPVTFLTSLDDPLERRLKTVGKVMPHIDAKIIDRNGNIVPKGVRGEICISGYTLQKGYWENKAMTDEVMKPDENQVLWMHTGDEGTLDDEGYCTITGRIKDIIIRGGENIFPAEIEERLLRHPAINEACVVGMPDDRYGEVVSCFVRLGPSAERPKASEISDWVRQAMGSHKAPKYVWWVGGDGVCQDFPKTGSGKYQKHILREIGQALIKGGAITAKL